MHPFRREGSETRLRDMNLHQLPWPLEELQELGETQVEMRVTLSYFVEPNPSARGFRSRYRYESHGLRFDVKRPEESERDFRTRINVAARDEEERTRNRGSDSGWVIGTQNRHKGSLHSDIWRGSAVDLASRGTLAVYPALGWWKTRPRLERYDKPARYSLIVSIRAPEVDVDLYSSVENQIATSGTGPCFRGRGVNERISLSSIAPWPGELVSAEGRYQEGDEETGIEKRTAIFIGPEFDTGPRPGSAVRGAGDAGFDARYILKPDPETKWTSLFHSGSP